MIENMRSERYETDNRNENIERKQKTQEVWAVENLEQEEKEKKDLKHLKDLEGTNFMKLIDNMRQVMHIESSYIIPCNTW